MADFVDKQADFKAQKFIVDSGGAGRLVPFLQGAMMLDDAALEFDDSIDDPIRNPRRQKAAKAGDRQS